MESLGVRMRVDAAGNLRGLSSSAAHSPRLLIGSHLDTVPNAGAYDGILGIVLPSRCSKHCKDEDFFRNRSRWLFRRGGVRFGTPFIGSLALVGRLDQQLLDVHDAQASP